MCDTLANQPHKRSTRYVKSVSIRWYAKLQNGEATQIGSIYQNLDDYKKLIEKTVLKKFILDPVIRREIWLRVFIEFMETLQGF